MTFTLLIRRCGRPKPNKYGLPRLIEAAKQLDTLSTSGIFLLQTHFKALEGLEAELVRKKTKAFSGRKVHITLPEKTHQLLRIKCAIEDVTIQEFVALLIEDSVAGVEVVQNDWKIQKES